MRTMATGRWKRAIAALGVTAAMAATLVAVSPGTAHAAVPCPAGPNEVQVFNGTFGKLFAILSYYRVLTVTPKFMVAESRVVDNTTDLPASATLTSQQSQTFQVSATIGSTVKITEFLSSTVSVSIVQIRTTSIGVNVTTMVPPRSRLVGDYGVEAFDVTYNVDKFIEQKGQCTFFGSAVAQASAPTTAEGWRLRTV